VIINTIFLPLPKQDQTDLLFLQLAMRRVLILLSIWLSRVALVVVDTTMPVVVGLVVSGIPVLVTLFLVAVHRLSQSWVFPYKTIM